ncbi:ATP-binding protein, partial [Mesorhizobium sp. M7A.F.Ca.AU.002.02.1.1]
FIRFFEERCRRQGIYILDEPESALSPTRQIELLKMLRRMDQSGTAQVIMATHSPLLMACPGARLFRISRFGLDPTDFSDTDHFRMMRDFCTDPQAFMEEALREDDA